MATPKVHHVSCATLCPISAHLVNGGGGWLRRGSMVCHCWLVEGSEGLILVDTGLGSSDLAQPAARLGRWFETVVGPDLGPDTTALAAVKHLGFAPRDVRHIIPTHLDLDHAGGMPDFPWATVHVYHRERDAALHPASLRERERYRAVHFAHDVQWDARTESGQDWLGFTAVQAMDATDDILLVPLLGHTRGHCGVAVRTAGGWMLHAGDAYFHHAEMTTPKDCPWGLQLFQTLVAMDNPTRLHNQQRLRQLVAAQGPALQVHSAHCPVEFATLKERPAAAA